MRPCLISIALLLLLQSAPFAQRCSAASTGLSASSAALPRSSPEAQGVSSAALVNLLEQIQDLAPGIRSISVVRHGSVVLDVRIAPFGFEDRHDIHSCTKSVLSMLVGIALERGELPGLDTAVLEFFPEYEPVDTAKRSLTLRHLLTMSAGLKTEDSYLYDWAGLRRMRASPDWAAYILGLPMQSEPGKRFEYSNCVSELLAIILQKATGQSLSQYAAQHLFGPLGIVDYAWQGSAPGDSWGYSGLSMQPLDMARLGLLYLQGGEWQGNQVVPKDWVVLSTTEQISAGTLAAGYGYQWWVDEDMFMMQGHGGQFVYVVPSMDLVVVFTSALPSRRFFVPRGLLLEVRTAVRNERALPASDATVQLEGLIQSLRRGSVVAPGPMPEQAHLVSGRTYTFADNSMGLQSLSLRFVPDTATAQVDFRMVMAGGNLTVGLDGVFRISEIQGRRWACRGNWEDAQTFVLEQELPGKVFGRRIRLRFEGDTLAFEVQDRITGAVQHYQALLEKD